MTTTAAKVPTKAHIAAVIARIMKATVVKQSRNHTYQDEFKRFIRWVEANRICDKDDMISLYITHEAVDAYFTCMVVLCLWVKISVDTYFTCVVVLCPGTNNHISQI
jgi:chorismate mutase